MDDTSLPFSNITSGDEDGDSRALRYLCTQLFRKEIVKPPQTFTREDDIHIHLKKVDEFLRMTNISNGKDKVYVLVESLHGDLQKELKMTRDFQVRQNDYHYVKDTVVELFKRKVAPITPFLRLLKTTQMKEQSVEDFARVIRIRAFDLIYDRPEEEREKYMLECFSNGLRNKALSTCLRLLQPTTLAEAVKSIKKEEKQLVDEPFDSVNEITCSAECQFKIAELTKEIAGLKRKIDAMMDARRWPQQPNTRRWPQQPQTQYRRPERTQGRLILRTGTSGGNDKNTLRCHNCNQQGHFANACHLPKRCYNCGRSGHISRFCRQSRQVHLLHEESKDDKAENRSVQSSLDAEVELEEYPLLSVSNRYESLSDECNNILEETEEICTVESTTSAKPRSPPRAPKSSRNGQAQKPTLLDKQVAFIEGRGPRPNDQDVGELPKIKANVSFHNKPVIKCRLNGDRVSTLMDTGATCNLLSKEIFDVIRAKDDCHLQRTNNRVSCANDTSLNCLGEVSLHFSLGGITMLVKFLVVDGLKNCQAIIGLRTMKKLGIQFDFKRDCIILNDIMIPFDSHVSPATTVRRVGNGVPLN